ncbi:MAG: response regulator transcription factor [Dorea sp.]|nr:response regulator transcription factor [Dorea sp.]MCI9248036.1 response regulator transcription factor [Dorea sp.]
MYTILVLEDDFELNQTVSDSLKKNGYRVLSAYTCKEGQKLAKTYTFNMAILDVNLPDGDGFQFCKWLKARCNSAVLFLSARDLEDDLLDGYDSGADDYVTKPFSMKVLLKKISVLLSKVGRNPNVYDDGFLKIDFELGLVHAKQKDCSLTPTEYRILKKLIDNKGQLLTYSTLLDSLWEEGVQLLDKHALAVNINRLRKKIETEERTYISNVYGMGYIWK